MLSVVLVWLHTYARRQNEKFYEYIGDFQDDQVSYHFLKGFYYRFKRDNNNALFEFDEVLRISPDHSRAKREKVNIYLRDNRFDEALSMARFNYEHRRGIIFHLQSYFIALAYRHNKTVVDIEVIKNLMEEAKEIANSVQKAKDIYACMKGDYEYYINNNFNQAESLLLEAKRTNKNKYFPLKSLYCLYKKNQDIQKMREIEKELNNIDED